MVSLVVHLENLFRGNWARQGSCQVARPFPSIALPSPGSTQTLVGQIGSSLMLPCFRRNSQGRPPDGSRKWKHEGTWEIALNFLGPERKINAIASGRFIAREEWRSSSSFLIVVKDLIWLLKWAQRAKNLAVPCARDKLNVSKRLIVLDELEFEPSCEIRNAY